MQCASRRNEAVPGANARGSSNLPRCLALVGFAMLTLAIGSGWLERVPGGQAESAPAAGLPRGFPPPSTPQQTLASIVVPRGLRVELVAAEPDIVDPVAFTWDAAGRLYVVEMNDYPTGPPGGRIKLLQGIRGHGKIDRVSVFADGLPFPDGVFPWRKGILVTAAPNIWYLEDRDGDGRADIKQVFFTGFHEGNPQHRVNGLVWGLDNWIYGCNGDSGGLIRAPDKPDRPAREIRGRDFRFRPDSREIEPISGQSQYGQTFDAWGRRFICNNRVHIRLVQLQERYLRRVPDLVLINPVLNIAEYGPVGAKVFPLSQPQERFNDYTHSGHFTSACSVHVYLGDLLPPEYQGCAYTCEPVHNLIHRCRIVPRGSSFVAERVDNGCEFFAARDPWCRPVYINTGPDGAFYVADFYRAVVEHPQWIPPEVQKRLNLRAGEDGGRIYRIVPENFRSWNYPDLQRLPSAQLVPELCHPNIWRRDTAQRLLYERQDKSVVPALQQLARDHADPQARLRALWTLEGLQALSDDLIASALTHGEVGLRENALILAEPRLSQSPSLQAQVLQLVRDPEPRIRFQVALSLGEMPPDKAYPALAEIARQDAEDQWIRLAILTSVGQQPLTFVETLMSKGRFLESNPSGRLNLLTGLGRLIGSCQHPQEVARFLELTLSPDLALEEQLALALSVAEGQARRNPLALVLQKSTVVSDHFRRLQDQATMILKQSTAPVSERIQALRFLSIWSAGQIPPVAEEFLQARYPNELQLAAVEALGRDFDERKARLLLARLAQLSPGVRSEAMELLFRTKTAAPWILEVLEKGELRPSDLDGRRRQQLSEALPAEARARLEKILGRPTPRRDIVRKYRDVLQLPANPTRGKEVFLKHCAQCHQRDGMGIAVGPNLDDVRGRPPEHLLEEILDPNAAVAPNYFTYVVETYSGQTYTGILASETATRIVLLRAEGARDEIPRQDIAEIRATPISLMPEGLEQTLSRQDLADLIAWLRQP